MKVQRIGYDPNYADGAGSGITKCPYDPDTNHTILFVGKFSSYLCLETGRTSYVFSCPFPMLASVFTAFAFRLMLL